MENWRTMRHSDRPVYPETLEDQEKALLSDPQLEDFKRIRRDKKDEPYRPVYHFIRPDGTLNDPNGLCFWEGRWHLFYQALDPCIHWGHAVSDDMIYWRDLPYAISPGDEAHCFSGGTCVDEENHRVIAAYYGFTGYDPETGYKHGIVIATSSDPLLLNWTKVKDGAPVIPDGDAPCWTPPDAPPVKDQKPYQVFDSYIWKENGVYYLLTAGYTPDPVTGRRHRQVYLHRCTDDGLTDWEFVKPLLERDHFREPGDDGACPYFIPIGDGKRLFIHFSHRCAPKYLIGDYDPETLDFVPFSGARLTSGYQVMVAPSAFPCGNGETNCIFNMMEQRGHNGWGGVMTLPRRLFVGGVWNDELYQKPFADLSVLHESTVEYTDVKLETGVPFIPEDMQSNAFEMSFDLKADGIPQTLEIEVLRSADGRERTRISFFRFKGGMYAILPYCSDSVIMLDTTCSSLEGATQLPPETAPVVMSNQDDLNIRIFVDKSIVEVFVNDRHCIQQRAYPTLPDSTGVSVLARCGEGCVSNLRFHTMKSIWTYEE